MSLSATHPTLGIVIVNYRTPDMLRDCLRSIFMSEGVSPSVCVVDNASGDESAAMVRREFPDVTLFVQSKNQGYAHANNIGLRHFGFSTTPGTPAAHAPDYALLLNPDTLLPAHALADMVAFMQARPACGAAGPKLIRADGSLDLACRRTFPSPEVSFWRLAGLSKLFPRHRRFGQYNLTYINEDVTVELDSVVGAFMMMRRDALAQAGLLDETFFMYGEDLDLAYRIKQAGWQIWYNAAVTVLHYKGSSSKQVSGQSIYHFYDAMRIFHRKHYRQSLPQPLNVAIEGAIWALCRVMLVRNALRKPEQRGVASAV
jgi:N-acetylglucosaminyl-diphospho-decaprenol L-rhamnosyltransferase